MILVKPLVRFFSEQILSNRGKGKIVELIWLPFVPGCARSLILLSCTYRLASVPLHLHPLPSKPGFHQNIAFEYLNHWPLHCFRIFTDLTCISLCLSFSPPPVLHFSSKLKRKQLNVLHLRPEPRVADRCGAALASDG